MSESTKSDQPPTGAAVSVVAEGSAAPAPSRTLDFAGVFDVAARSLNGNQLPVRPRNDDNFLLIDAGGRAVWLRGAEETLQQSAVWVPGRMRLAVMDGLGGHGLGQELAEATAEALAGLPPFSTADEMTKALDALHLSLRGQFRIRFDAGESRFPPGTTLTVLDIDSTGRALLYHVGDSRLYRVGPKDGGDGIDEVEQLTIDHVEATQAMLCKLLSLEQWRLQTQLGAGTRIAQAFGFGSTLGAEIGSPSQPHATLRHLRDKELPPDLQGMADCREFHLRVDSVYLLATDGWWATPYMADWFARWPAELLKWGNTLSGALDDLVIELLINPPAELRQDNTTAVALRWRRTADDATLAATAALPKVDEATLPPVVADAAGEAPPFDSGATSAAPL